MSKAFRKDRGLDKGQSKHGPLDQYRTWAKGELFKGLNGLLQNDIRAFEEGGLKYIEVLEKAEEDGMEKVVEEGFHSFKASLKRKREQKAFAELELFVDLMKIKDSFQRWKALGESVAARWPKDYSAVRAVRELRRR